MSVKPKAPEGWKHATVQAKNRADCQGLQCVRCGVVIIGRLIDDVCFRPHRCDDLKRKSDFPRA